MDKILIIKNISNSPVLIVGSGPTAEEILKIKNLKKYIIITIPQTLRLFKINRIKPDIVVMVDAGYPNRLYKTDIDSPLISYIYSSHEFIKNYKGIISFVNSNSPIDATILSGFPIIPVGGSVGSTCIEIAKNISDTIIIAGFDFTIIDGYYHYKKSPIEENSIFYSNKINTVEKKITDIITNNSFKISNNIYTNNSMISYKKEFLNRIYNTNKKIYRISNKSLEELEIINIDNLKIPGKKIYFEKIDIDKNIKTRIIEEIKNIYLKKDLNNQFLNTHLKRWILKNDNESIDYEIKKIIEKIDMIKN